MAYPRRGLVFSLSPAQLRLCPQGLDEARGRECVYVNIECVCVCVCVCVLCISVGVIGARAICIQDGDLRPLPHQFLTSDSRPLDGLSHF